MMTSVFWFRTFENHVPAGYLPAGWSAEALAKANLSTLALTKADLSTLALTKADLSAVALAKADKGNCLGCINGRPEGV
jgi:uncharacterized protein YjbI with pentapeptide repeats